MKHLANKIKVVVVLFTLLFVLLALSLVFSTGCTDKLAGEMNANQKPIVYFVNIPPEGQSFSRNPEIHWFGTDTDGLISYFRYCVVTSDEMGGMAPLEYASSLSDDEWIRLDVEPKGPDPQTSNIVSMSADLDDPVLTYVDQYVFLQAFDNEGLASDIIWRLFSRNDNPPNTVVYGFNSTDTPFVNSVEPGGIITGVKVRWQGEDPVDYPQDPPPFEYNWRLYGPYTNAEMAVIRDSFFTSVCLTTEGKVFRMGDTIERCDTLFQDDSMYVECTTFVCTPDMEESAFLSVHDYFRADDPDFLTSEFFVDGNGIPKLVDTSFNGVDGWVTGESDTLWNVYRYFESDTTVKLNYIFWIRSRDDALVPDLVPGFTSFNVINPRYERDICVLDFTQPGPSFPNYTKHIDTAKAFWTNAINTWADNNGLDIAFDTTKVTNGILADNSSGADYIFMPKHVSGAPLSELLKHKVLILYNDRVGAPQSDMWGTTYKAIDAGINVWLTMRSPLGEALPIGSLSPPTLGQVPSDPDYTRYFGVEAVDFSGWFCFAWYLQPTECDIKGLYQDFIGTYSKDTIVWPELTIDTALLHQRYQWSLGSFHYWDEDHPALPEVDWCQRSFGTEIIYKYKSLYGQSHPLGSYFSFQGRPVAHRYPTNLYRTAHFNFTPLSIEPEPMQQVVDSLLNWLYDPTVGQEELTAARYKDGNVRISLSEAREAYREMCRRFDEKLEKYQTEPGIMSR